MQWSSHKDCTDCLLCPSNAMGQVWIKNTMTKDWIKKNKHKNDTMMNK